jgi:hypothetical protein
MPRLQLIAQTIGILERLKQNESLPLLLKVAPIQVLPYISSSISILPSSAI